MSSKVKLTEVTSQFLDIIRGGEAEFARAYRIAKRGLDILEMDVVGEIETYELSVNPDYTVDLPENTINLISVGLLNSNGEIADLTHNDRLSSASLPRNKDYNLETLQGQTGFGISTSLGVGSSKNIGEYFHDRGSNRLLLNVGFSQPSIVVRCLTRHVDANGDYYINSLAVEALIAFMNWQWNINSRKIGSYEKGFLRNEFYNEKRKAKQRAKNITKQKLVQSATQRTKLGAW